jgi:hypothetical protein
LLSGAPEKCRKRGSRGSVAGELVEDGAGRQVAASYPKNVAALVTQAARWSQHSSGVSTPKNVAALVTRRECRVLAYSHENREKQGSRPGWEGGRWGSGRAVGPRPPLGPPKTSSRASPKARKSPNSSTGTRPGRPTGRRSSPGQTSARGTQEMPEKGVAEKCVGELVEEMELGVRSRPAAPEMEQLSRLDESAACSRVLDK